MNRPRSAENVGRTSQGQYVRSLRGGLDQDVGAFDADGVDAEVAGAFVDVRAVGEIEAPFVEGAGDVLAEDHAVADGAVGVGTTVIDAVQLAVASVDEHVLVAGELDVLAATLRNLLQFRDFVPRHGAKS